MGGEIELESTPGKGSKFIILIPNIEKGPDIKRSIASKSIQDTDKVIPGNAYDTDTEVLADIHKIDSKILSELNSEFKPQWEQLNKSHLINEIVSFAADILLFSKRKDNSTLIKFCSTFLFNLHNFDIDHIEKSISILGIIFNTNKIDVKNR